MTKSLFTSHGERVLKLLQLVHTNVSGPMTTQGKGAYSYSIIFTEDMSRLEYIYLMKYKSKVFDSFK